MKRKISLIGFAVILIVAFAGISQAGPITGTVMEISVGDSGTVLKIKRTSDNAEIPGIVDDDIANRIIAVALTAKSNTTEVRAVLKGPDGQHASQWWQDVRILE